MVLNSWGIGTRLMLVEDPLSKRWCSWWWSRRHWRQGAAHHHHVNVQKSP